MLSERLISNEFNILKNVTSLSNFSNVACLETRVVLVMKIVRLRDQKAKSATEKISYISYIDNGSTLKLGLPLYKVPTDLIFLPG